MGLILFHQESFPEEMTHEQRCEAWAGVSQKNARIEAREGERRGRREGEGGGRERGGHFTTQGVWQHLELNLQNCEK